MAQTVKSLPAMRENHVRFLGWKDPLEKEMAAHFSILPWKILNGGAWQATVHRVSELDTSEVTSLNFTSLLKLILSRPPITFIVINPNSSLHLPRLFSNI